MSEAEAEAEAVFAALTREHVPELVYFDEWHVTIPAEVCWGCSDPDAGRWVPVSFCPQAKAVMTMQGEGRP